MNQEATHTTDDLRIKELKELISPASLISELPVTDEISKTVLAARAGIHNICLLYTSPSPRDATLSRMPSSA